MAYVEWHDGIRNHHKTTALMLALRLKRWQAVGIVGCLSSWAIQYRPGGIIERKLVHLAIEWDDDPATLLAALISSGWLDPVNEAQVSIHDWEDITKGYQKARNDAKRRFKGGLSDADALGKRGSSAVQAENRTEQSRTEQSGTSGVPETAKAVPERPPVKGSIFAVWVRHWNDQAGRHPISEAKGVAHIEAAISGGIPAQKVEQIIWDNAACKGLKIWEAFDAHRPDQKEAASKARRMAGYAKIDAERAAKAEDPFKRSGSNWPERM